MDKVGKPRDLTPQAGKLRDLSAPKQGDLTPAAAQRALEPGHTRRKPRRERQDPVEKGRGGLEMLLYGVVLIVVIVFQLLSYLEREDGENLLSAPEVTSIEVENRESGERYQVDGNRLEKPDCETGEASIRARVASVEGSSMGRIQVEAESHNGEWELLGRGILAGGARVQVEAIIDCGDGE